MNTTRNVYADEDSAINRLSRNGIHCSRAIVEIPKSKNVGIKLWGAIDFLEKQYGYSWCRLSR